MILACDRRARQWRLLDNEEAVSYCTGARLDVAYVDAHGTRSKSARREEEGHHGSALIASAPVIGRRGQNSIARNTIARINRREGSGDQARLESYSGDRREGGQKIRQRLHISCTRVPRQPDSRNGNEPHPLYVYRGAARV